MIRSMIATLSFMSSIALVFIDPASAAGEWLIGDWSGYASGWKQGDEVRDIGARVLHFDAPQTDGSMTGTMAVPGAPTASLTGKIQGETATFDSSSGTQLLLKRSNDQVTASYTLRSGTSSNMPLARPQRVTTLDGTWKGSATTIKSDQCWPGEYEIAIKNGAISGTVHFIQFAGGGRDRRTFYHDSDVTGEVWPDGNIFIALAGRGPQTRTTFFHAKLDGGAIKAVDPGGGNCEYRVELKKL